MSFAGQKIGVGVCGGIAAYKACELIRALRKGGAEVRVAMTESAHEFVGALTFASLSEKPVLTSLFDGHEKSGTVHLDFARWADVLVICPATANIIAKVAHGLADDILTTSILASTTEVIFCPAMNSAMWEKAAVQKNVEKLKSEGYLFVPPEFGVLATSAEGEGWGRLASSEHILDRLKLTIFGSGELAGKKVLVTAGATREPLDPVRFFSNHSTGKMGFALADAARMRGADVVLIAGPNNLQKHSGVKYIEISTVAQLKDAVETEYENADVLLMAAAVSDYRPRQVFQQKMKKAANEITVVMEKNPDILASLSKQKNNRVHVGFALETEDEMTNAREKMRRKHLDVIVINNPLQPGAAFAGDTNIVTVIDRDGKVDELSLRAKSEVADFVLEKVCHMLPVTEKRVAAL